MGIDLAYRKLTNEQVELIKNLLATYSKEDWSIGRVKYKRLEAILYNNCYHLLTDRLMLNDLRRGYINHIKILNKSLNNPRKFFGTKKTHFN